MTTSCPPRISVAAIIVIAASRCGLWTLVSVVSSFSWTCVASVVSGFSWTCAASVVSGFSRPCIILSRTAASVPRTPLSAASRAIGSSPYRSITEAIAVSRMPGGSAPSDAASCFRSAQSAPSSRFNTAACIG
jgi:hypothetical protein